MRSWLEWQPNGSIRKAFFVEKDHTATLEGFGPEGAVGIRRGVPRMVRAEDTDRHPGDRLVCDRIRDRACDGLGRGARGG